VHLVGYLKEILFRCLRGGTKEIHEHLSGDTVCRGRLKPQISGIQVKGQYEVEISRFAVLGNSR
jgi:hypothetical protein